MHQEQRQRTHAFLKNHGIFHALFAHIDSVKWLTGFHPPVEVGPNFFLGGPPLVWYSGGHFTLIVLDIQADSVADLGDDSDCSLVTYPSYTIDAPIEGQQHLIDALKSVLDQSGPMPDGLGVEARWLPVAVWQLLRETFSTNLEYVALDDWLMPLRAIKTAEELEKLRQNFRLTDIAHAAARQAVQAGQREIDVYAAVESAIHKAAGQRVPIGNDFVVGYRQANIGGWPLDYPIREHDSFIADISTIQYGYWSDSCATYFAGEPTQEQIAMHRTALEALEIAIGMVKPGVIVRDIDQAVRDFFSRAGYPVYPHHTGHGVGVSGHETPRIVPYNDEVLEAGMVIMLEPGVYFPGKTGVRVEDGMLVTNDGAELLTHHDKSL
ncbi:MAG: Xaa-Pro peptidase family protein [Anaerolineae bacterium]|nr:Xaa-Pro peptidase family protein [Anaerolineae bacterium]